MIIFVRKFAKYYMQYTLKHEISYWRWTKTSQTKSICVSLANFTFSNTLTFVLEKVLSVSDMPCLKLIRLGDMRIMHVILFILRYFYFTFYGNV